MSIRKEKEAMRKNWLKSKYSCVFLPLIKKDVLFRVVSFVGAGAFLFWFSKTV